MGGGAELVSGGSEYEKVQTGVLKIVVRICSSKLVLHGNGWAKIHLGDISGRGATQNLKIAAQFSTKLAQFSTKLAQFSTKLAQF